MRRVATREKPDLLRTCVHWSAAIASICFGEYSAAQQASEPAVVEINGQSRRVVAFQPARTEVPTADAVTAVQIDRIAALPKTLADTSTAISQPAPSYKELAELSPPSLAPRHKTASESQVDFPRQDLEFGLELVGPSPTPTSEAEHYTSGAETLSLPVEEWASPDELLAPYFRVAELRSPNDASIVLPTPDRAALEPHKSDSPMPALERGRPQPATLIELPNSDATYAAMRAEANAALDQLDRLGLLGSDGLNAGTIEFVPTPRWLTNINLPILGLETEQRLNLDEAVVTAIAVRVGLPIKSISAQRVLAQAGNDFEQKDWEQFVLQAMEEPIALSPLQVLPDAGRTQVDLAFARSMGLELLEPSKPNAFATDGLHIQITLPNFQTGGYQAASYDLRLTSDGYVDAALLAAQADRTAQTVSRAYFELLRTRGEWIVAARAYNRIAEAALAIETPQSSATISAWPLALERYRSSVDQAAGKVRIAQEALAYEVFGPQFQLPTEVEVIPTTDVFGPISPVNLNASVQAAIGGRVELRQMLWDLRNASLSTATQQVTELAPLLALIIEYSEPSLPGNRWTQSNLQPRVDWLRPFVRDFKQQLSAIVMEVRNSANTQKLSGLQRRAAAQNLAVWHFEAAQPQRSPHRLAEIDVRISDAERATLSAGLDYADSLLRMAHACGTAVTANN